MFDVDGPRCHRKITDSGPQYLHLSLGRSLNGGCDGVCVAG
jgi:hypothetical protein